MIIDRYYNKYSNLIDKCEILSLFKVKGLIYYVLSFFLTIRFSRHTKNNKELIINNYLKKKPVKNLIVSLTSYGKRIQTVHLTLFSILLQSIRPEKILLWISYEDEEIVLRNSVLKSLVESKVIEINYCEDLKSHKKYFFTMLNHPDADILTIDDDVYYPENLILELVRLNNKFPHNICCSQGKIMKYKNGFFGKYKDWKNEKKIIENSLLLCPIGVGGVLYPANCLDKSVFNKKDIRKSCLMADDLWLKTMSILNRTKVSKTNEFSQTFLTISRSQKTALGKKNVKMNENDIQLTQILKIYGTKLEKIIRESEDNQ